MYCVPNSYIKPANCQERQLSLQYRVYNMSYHQYPSRLFLAFLLILVAIVTASLLLAGPFSSDAAAATSYEAELVRDINTHNVGSSPNDIIVFNSTMYFEASNGILGYELWKSDGTSAGTMLIKDIRHGSEASDNWYMASVNGTLFFNARAATCCTAASTSPKQSIRAGTTRGSPIADN